MLMNCEVCRQQTDVAWSQAKERAICTECGGYFDVLDFTKRALINSGSVVRDIKANSGFTHACHTCGMEREVVIDGNNVKCATCGLPMQLPEAMLEALKSRGGINKAIKFEAEVGGDPSERLSFAKGGRKKPKKMPKIKV